MQVRLAGQADRALELAIYREIDASGVRQVFVGKYDSSHSFE